jgi:DNA-binding NarL/FixJ family response regulator
MSDTPLTVLIVDDHFVVRSGLAASLELDDGIKVLGEAERGEDVVAAYKQWRPQVVLMDLQLPGMGGIAATAALREHDRNAKVLIFSTFARDDEIQAALDAGALGYLQKSASREELLNALRGVAQGRRHHTARARDFGADRERTGQQGNRGRARRVGGHGETARESHPGKTQRERSRPSHRRSDPTRDREDGGVMPQFRSR